MEKMLIGLAGPAGSGKDTIADHLVAKHGFVKMALADLLKRVARDVFAFSNEQLWGPSELRNAPDKRYPRSHSWSRGACVCCGYTPQMPADSFEASAPDDPPCYLTPRFVLQIFGTEAGRGCYPTIWVERLLGLAQEVLKCGGRYDAKTGLDAPYDLAGQKPAPPPAVIISDVRFPNEIEAIKAAGGKMVRVIRGGLDSHGYMKIDAAFRENTSLSDAPAQHRSETELLSIGLDKFDYVFQNSGDLAFLRLQADRMMDVLQRRIMSFDRGLQDAPPFLRDKCKKLAATMSALSQKYFQSEWHDECASRLWYALQNRGELGYADHDTPPVYMSEEELKNLKELSDMVPGWFSWKDKTYDAPYFVRRSAWLEEYAKRRP